MTDAHPAPGTPEGEPQETAAPPAGLDDDSVVDPSVVDPSVVDPSVVDPVETPDATPLADELAVTQMALAERTSDLQRLQAEFVNYKRRVERDRELIKQNATYAALSPIIEVLDTVDLAREHGELEGGFKSVADQLERVVARQGLLRFGAPGDAFDPHLHEALSHIGTDPEVTVTTAQHIAKVGYRIGDRVVRAAQVLVVDPADG